ncbi:MAG: invasion associated locus B family protein [Phreatobacter sp.]
MFRSKLLLSCAVIAGIAVAAGTVFAQQPAPAANPRRPAPAPAPAPLAAPLMPQMAQLPNGATSINETYGDWTVDCRIIEGRKACALSQSQGNQQTGQRTFAIELRLPENGKTDGVLLLPFGLNLDLGVKLKIDEQDLGQGVRFSTCLPSGCLAPISLPTVATEALKKGTRLIVSATSLSSGEAATFNVSLNGFAAAIARIVQLGG